MPDSSPKRPLSRGVHAFLRAFVRLTQRGIRRNWLDHGVLWVGVAIVGVLAVLFARWNQDVLVIFQDWISGRAWLALFITPVFTAVAVWVTRRWFRGAEGSGIPQVIAALRDPRDSGRNGQHFSLRILTGKIGVGLFAVLGGLTFGPEGPSVHIGASVMYEMRRFFPRPTLRLERLLILVGAAAGLSAAFNTPLAGVLFAIEELYRNSEIPNIAVVVVGIVVAGLVSLAIAGNYLYFGQLNAPETFPLAFALPVLAAAVLCGFAGATFNLLLLRHARWIPSRLMVWRDRAPLVWGAALGLLVAIIGIATGGETWGSGYEQARHLVLNHGSQVGWFYPLAKMVSMLLSNFTGLPGGLFAPALSIGAGFGRWISQWFGRFPQPAIVAVAMVGFMSAVTQSPLTSFVVVMEMVNGSGLIIPLMAASLISSRISGLYTEPLYGAIAHQNYMEK